MQDHYTLLQTIYEIVKNDPQPQSYACRPRELILRSLQEWSSIHHHIILLQQEGLVTTEQQDTLVIRITQTGLEKVKEKNSLVSE
jgi:DNA-binding transcriptional ArsR family regulator